MISNTTVGTGSDTLVLKITQDYYLGDAQYAVFVDGKQMGGTFTAKARHGSGEFDTLTVKGDWPAGAHNVTVKLLNDAWGGTAATDRNVYVESATYNGKAVANSYRYVNSPEPKTIAITDDTAIPTTPTTPTTPTAGQTLNFGTGSDTMTVKFTQDYYQGDAQFAVLVDGKQIGGTFTAKALHGGTIQDTLVLKGNWGVGPHKVEFKLLNDAWGGTAATDRNLWIEKVNYNGADVPGSNLYVNSPAIKGVSYNDTTAIPGTTPTDPTGPTNPPIPTNKLVKTTTAIKSSYAGQIIENLDIWVESGNAITITHDNVIVRNVRIHHKTGDGIHVNNAKNVTITKAEVINSDPPKGVAGETDTSINNIEAYRAPDLKISYVTVRDGATGIYVQESPRTIIDHTDGYNFHGGFPRGQFVQFGTNSDNSKLTNFYTKSDLLNSRTEDNINVYHANNVLIENGVVDGNNSPSGVGVLFEGDSGGGIVRNVDVVRQSNGGFSSYSNNVDFFDVRVFDGHMNTLSGRGAPMSNGLSFAVTANGITYDDATYTRPANPNNIFWGSHAAEFKDITSAPNATVMNYDGYTNEWNWIL